MSCSLPVNEILLNGSLQAFANEACVVENCFSLHIGFHSDASFFSNFLQRFFGRVTLTNQISSQHCSGSSDTSATRDNHRISMFKHSIDKIHELKYVFNCWCRKISDRYEGIFESVILHLVIVKRMLHVKADNCTYAFIP